MTLAFYAPLKSPDHPVPSGDRSMARALIAQLERLGFPVVLASTLRSRDGAGDQAVQAEIRAQAHAARPGLIEQGRAQGWRAWITYHNYYKAPDLLGPTVSQALNIPYLLIEATRAKKRLHGTWCRFAKAAEAATDAAAVVFYLTLRDAETLQRDAPDGQKLLHLKPFLPLETLPPAAQLEGPMLSVGMMRAGDKLASYRIIAEVLAQLPQGGWRLQIAGDGPARADVTALMAPFGEAVTFLGRLDRTALAETYQNAQLMLWPGVNEAFGMAYLEAQAHGVPVIAQDRPGVREVLAPGNHPTVDAGAPGLTARVQALLSDVKTRHAAGAAARAHVAAHHLAPHARETLQRGLEHVGVRP